MPAGTLARFDHKLSARRGQSKSPDCLWQPGLVYCGYFYLPRAAIYFPICTSAILFTPLSVITMLPSRVVIMLRTTPPPEGIAQV